MMLCMRLALCLLALAWLNACSPTLNWREVRPEGTALRLLLPCKPDKAEKAVPLGGQNTRLRMQGCQADGATFAIAVARLEKPVEKPVEKPAADPALILAQWQSLALSNMGAPPVPASAVPLKIQGLQNPSAGLVAPLRIRTTGKRADGTTVVGEMVFFADGGEVFQAVVYGSVISSEMGDTFFGSLAFDR